MTDATDTPERSTWFDWVRRRAQPIDVAAQPDDGLISFSVMWAVALMFSVVGNFEPLLMMRGREVAFLNYAVLLMCAVMFLNPRRTWVLGLLAGSMAIQYLYRLPVASNNQTIAFFMNCAIVVVIGLTIIKGKSNPEAREEAYEQLRIVARCLLATMYFYGIFHKINVEFLDSNYSCAVSLYRPLAHPFGLQDNLIGRYGSIASTFIVEGITLVCLFWRRFFAVGLIVGLVFHYIIPISAFSWYMDFSSLVFALYVLSVPREVSVAFYARSAALLRKLPAPKPSIAAIIALLLVLAGSAILITALSHTHAARPVRMLWHSAWLINWALIGGAAMIMMTYAALESLPYKPLPAKRQPAWLYIIPGILFISCLSPYFGLKTESSIAMFSNLQTEGGVSNHLLIRKPINLFGYQRSVAKIEDSSSTFMTDFAERDTGVVRFALERWLVEHPTQWVSFTMDGKHYERATSASLGLHAPNALERRLLIFKPVPLVRPDDCTH